MGGFKALALNGKVLVGSFKALALNGRCLSGWFQASRLEWKGFGYVFARL